ncbi:MAG: flagellar biosynthetic protein FliR [Opitutaceae bacterium]|nr:flagellar biosynthetic protein FliR [Opitutaceae bacterium]
MPAWLMVMFRLSGIFILAPIFGSGTIPRIVKVMLVFSLTFCVYPMLLTSGRPSAATLGFVIDHGLSLWTLLPQVAMELMVGLIIGYCASMPLIGMQFGGDIIDKQIGIGFADIVNPESGEQSGVIANSLFMMGLAIFAILGGHRIMLMILVDSFDTVPLGGFRDFGGLVEMVQGMLAVVFQMAFRIAAPLLCLIFLQTVALGFIARTVPQLNIMSVGFTIRILNGITFLVAFISVAAWVYVDQLGVFLEELALFFSN